MDAKEVHMAILKEVESLKEFNVYEIVDQEEIPDEAEIIGTTLVLKQKGDIVKARICAQGFKKKKVREDTYSPTPTVSDTRLLLTLAARKRLTVKTGDFSTAFLHAPIDTETYVKAPKVLSQDGRQVY